ncbi:Serine/threonine-protein kinase ICK [Manis javanica]|nr:Serine/threonine-protein kinase ICK [Manis javanica]
MVMNYLEGATLQDFVVTARELKAEKVFRESTIRSLFDEVLRGLRIVHQHKMPHLDIKPANIFITNDDRAVMIDFGAAREVPSKEGNFIRPIARLLPLDDPQGFLVDALLHAHRQILRYASAKGMIDTPRTTLVAAVIQKGKITWIHCGDSRLYLAAVASCWPSPLVETALRNAGDASDNVTAIAMEWETPDAFESTMGISTQDIENDASNPRSRGANRRPGR